MQVQDQASQPMEQYHIHTTEPIWLLLFLNTKVSEFLCQHKKQCEDFFRQGIVTSTNVNAAGGSDDGKVSYNFNFWSFRR
jgi:hypothetical protein